MDPPDADADRHRATTLVRDLSRAGDAAAPASDELFALVYDRLRAIARGMFGGQRAGHTLQPTAIVHEAYVKLVDHEVLEPEDRVHFVRVAARAMRQVLVDHARARGAQKRGGDRGRVTLQGLAAEDGAAPIDLLALDEALVRLAALDARQALVVELRFFGGLTVDETAAVLGTAPRTVDVDWRMAKAWLSRTLGTG